jgi:hypothetical protein
MLEQRSNETQYNILYKFFVCSRFLLYRISSIKWGYKYNMKLRIWVDSMEPQDMIQDFMIDILREHSIQLHFHLEYGQLGPNFYEMLRVYNEKKIPISISATLPDKQGYWINERNARTFAKYTEDLIKQIHMAGCYIDGLSIDMQSPLMHMQAIKNPKRFFQPYLAYIRMATVNVNTRRYREAVRDLSSIQRMLKSKKIESYAILRRQVYYDVRFRTDIIQNAFETPVFSVPWDKYNIIYDIPAMRAELKHLNTEEIDYKVYYELSFLKQRIGDRLSAFIRAGNPKEFIYRSASDSFDRFSREIGIIKAAGVRDILLLPIKDAFKPKILEKYIMIAKTAQPVHPEKQDIVLKAENRYHKFFQIAKGYYSLYKI